MRFRPFQTSTRELIRELIRQSNANEFTLRDILMNQQQILDFITNTLAPQVASLDTNVKALLAGGTSVDLTPIQTALQGVSDSLAAVITESAPPAPGA